jgi:peptidyl-prolyl cis-trans isomerase SurA
MYNELRYLEIINDKFKNTKKKQAFEIAKRSLVREKIKEIELKRTVKELKIEDQFLNNVLINYFKKKQINSISDFEDYFNSIGINPNLIKKKITIEILWNQLIFNKYNKNVKIDKKKIIDNLEKNNKQIQFFLSEILFSVNKNEKLNDKFNLIKNKINETNFSEAALTYSVSDTANKGGELGWIKEVTLSKKIKNALKNITIGNYSNPIVIPGGFLILKIEDIREVDNNFDQDEEIKKIINEKTNEQLNQFSNIFFNKIQKDVKINEL